MSGADEAADVHAGRVVLGALMYADPPTMATVAARLGDGADFRRPSHQMTYRVITDLWANDVPPDPTAVFAELARRAAEEGATLAYGVEPVELADMVAAVPSLAMVPHYVDRVATAGDRRRTAEALALAAERIARGGDIDQVVTEVEKVLTARATGGRREGKLVTLSDVDPARVDWLWDGYLPRGKVVVVDGDPGTGKSTLTLDLAARVTTGSQWPDGAGGCGPAAVLLVSAEDDPADTIRPRLDTAGANPKLVHALVEMTDADGRARPVDLSVDLSVIEGEIRRHRVALVVIDPLMAFLGGGVDSHKDQDIRRALHPLARVAAETGATILIVRHLNKGGGGKALYRGGGSIGIVGAARVGFIIGRDPDDESRRILACMKINVGPEPASIAYRLVPDELRGVARIEWLGTVGLRADDLVATAPAADGGERRDAEAWLREYLSDAPDRTAQSADVKVAAREAGISDKILRRARESLKVVTFSGGFPRTTTWALPVAPSDAQSGTPLHWAALGTTAALGATAEPVESTQNGHSQWRPSVIGETA